MGIISYVNEEKSQGKVFEENLNRLRDIRVKYLIEHAPEWLEEHGLDTIDQQSASEYISSQLQNLPVLTIDMKGSASSIVYPLESEINSPIESDSISNSHSKKEKTKETKPEILNEPQRISRPKRIPRNKNRSTIDFFSSETSKK